MEMRLKERVGERFSLLGMTLKTIYRNLSRKKFEPEVFILSRFISKQSICVDIGAGYGRYTYPMAQLASQGKVYSFEPGPFSFKVLSRVISFHQLNNVIPVQKGVSSDNKTAVLSIPQKRNRRWGHSLAHINLDPLKDHRHQLRSVPIQQISLDNFCTEENISRVDFIKCDVEGAEGIVFAGAERIIDRDRPTILCEVDATLLRRYQHTPDHLQHFFTHRGYEIYVLRDNLTWVQQLKEDSNYFFIHPQKVKVNHAD